MINRGISTPDDARIFLNPRLNDLPQPHLMKGLDEAGARVCRAVMKGEKTGIVGDYDVDGITSAALMAVFLRKAGIEPLVRISRRDSGYGLGIEDIDAFRDADCSLILALDMGTHDHEALCHAEELGIDTIVVDHHIPGTDTPPECMVFVNPHQHGCEFPDKDLVAVGLSFYLAASARRHLEDAGFWKGESPDMREFLDLVALGTVADMGRLKGVNRIMVTSGLARMEAGMRTGLKHLWNSACRGRRSVSSIDISYRIAPRLNAAGRIEDARLAYDLLVSDEDEEAVKLTRELESLTNRRKMIEKQVLEEALSRNRFDTSNICFAAGAEWNRGVIGIVAARLSDITSLPAFVLSIDDEGICVGSARGADRIDVFGLIDSCSDMLERYGGHMNAAGLTVEKDRLEDLARRLDESAPGFAVSGKAALELDACLPPEVLHAGLVKDLERIAPFGAGNPEPAFLFSGLRIEGRKVVASEHLQLSLSGPMGRIRAFAPRMKMDDAPPEGAEIDMAASISHSDYSPPLNIELLVRDIREKT